MAELQEVREALTLDLWMEPSALALNEAGGGLGMRFLVAASSICQDRIFYLKI